MVSRASHQNVSRETFWFSHRGFFVKRRFVLFGPARAWIGIDATAALGRAGAAESSPKPRQRARDARGVPPAKSKL